MKHKLIALAFLSGTLFARGQGTFVWDQQNTGPVDGFAFLSNQPMGQPFTPSQSSLDVASLFLGSGGVPSDIEINLRSDSISGTILATSLPTTVPSASSDTYYFFFSAPVSLTPGNLYYLQPVAVNGSGVGANLVNAQNGTGGAVVGGAIQTDFNFWFQEGSVVPEPSSALLFLVSASLAYFYCFRRGRA